MSARKTTADVYNLRNREISIKRSGYVLARAGRNFEYLYIRLRLQQPNTVTKHVMRSGSLIAAGYCHKTCNEVWVSYSSRILSQNMWWGLGLL